MTYYIYHIPGKKIGVTRDLKKRVEEQQGYGPNEYDVIMKSDNINYISEQEIYLQKMYGYRVDDEPYNKLKFNNMNINVTEQTTTFPCPVSKLKGQLMDNLGMTWQSEHGTFTINKYSIDWIIKNVQTSKYNTERCYIYNKALARFYDNHTTHDHNESYNQSLADLHMQDQYNGKTRVGALSPTGVQNKKPEKDCGCNKKKRPEDKSQWNMFDYIRDWAEQRGLYNNGDPKTQALKLTEEVGETCRAILKQDKPEVIDGIGDCVVVLTNLAELCDTTIEQCIAQAYDEIKDRKGKMNNGTFKKD
jgi:NTP pyrophosphatase (non-canonical NTP hydrolase)